MRIDEVAPVVDAGRRRIEHHRMRALRDIDRVAPGIARGIGRLDEENDPRVNRLPRNRTFENTPTELAHRYRGGVGGRIVA